MSTPDSSIFLIVVLIIIVIWEIFTIRNHKDLIRESLEAKGEKAIKISWEPFDFDKSNHTYSVEYEDSEGRRMSRQCKIHAWGSTIYWEE